MRSGTFFNWSQVHLYVKRCTVPWGSIGFARWCSVEFLLLYTVAYLHPDRPQQLQQFLSTESLKACSHQPPLKKNLLTAS